MEKGSSSAFFSNMQKQKKILFDAHLLGIDTLSYFLVQKPQSQKSIGTYLMKTRNEEKNQLKTNEQSFQSLPSHQIILIKILLTFK